MSVVARHKEFIAVDDIGEEWRGRVGKDSCTDRRRSRATEELLRVLKGRSRAAEGVKKVKAVVERSVRVVGAVKGRRKEGEVLTSGGKASETSDVPAFVWMIEDRLGGLESSQPLNRPFGCE